MIELRIAVLLGAFLVDKSMKARVSQSRKLLENPYAHLEYSEAFEVELSAAERAAPRKTVETSRVKSSEAAGDALGQRRYTADEIEVLARDLQARLWKDRGTLWAGAPPSDATALLDPAVALRLIGYECVFEEGLGRYRADGGQVEVAGLINRTSRRVHVSRQFPLTVQMFTAAHELGHAMLHPTGGGIHRDRALDGVTAAREPEEVEADKFATYFLMPANLVKSRFTTLFGTERFILNEHTAFALLGIGLHEAKSRCRTQRDLSRLLASTERYNHRFFASLSVQFRVSSEAMAIRLEELSLLG